MLLYSLPILHDPRRNLYGPVSVGKSFPVVNAVTIPMGICLLYQSLRLLSIAQGAVNIPLSGFLGHIGAFIMQLLTLAEPQLHFHTRSLEVEGKRDERITLLRDEPGQPVDLPPVHEQAARAVGVLIEDVALLIGRDVHLLDVELPVHDVAPAVLEVAGAFAQGFDLGAEEFNPRLEAVLHKVVVTRLAVECDGLGGRSFHARTPFIVRLFLSFKNPQPADEKIYRQRKAGDDQFRRQLAESQPHGAQVDKQYAEQQHRQVPRDKPHKLKAEKALPRPEGPAAVDKVAVEHPRRIAAHLRKRHAQSGCNRQQRVDAEIDQRVRRAGDAELDHLFEFLAVEPHP